MYIFISLVYFLLVFQQKGGGVVNFNVNTMTVAELNSAVRGINQNPLIPEQAKKEAINDLYKDNGYIIVNNRPVKDTSKKKKKGLSKKLQIRISLVHQPKTPVTRSIWLTKISCQPKNKMVGLKNTITKRHLL
jgi:hypothetical protein